MGFMGITLVLLWFVAIVTGIGIILTIGSFVVCLATADSGAVCFWGE